MFRDPASGPLLPATNYAGNVLQAEPLRPLACFDHRAGVAPVLRTAPNDGLAPPLPGGSRAVGVMPPASCRPVLATLRNVPAPALRLEQARHGDRRLALGGEARLH